MKVMDLLSREHAAFRRLLDRLETDLDHPAPRAREEMSEALRILLPALDRHEEIEELAFERPASDDAADEKTLAEVAAQHRAIEALRGEILYALELAGECPFERLHALTGFLARNLRDHLSTEEIRLWPRYQEVLRRSFERDLSAHLDRRIRALEREVERGIAVLSAPL
ncbi:MAG: hypothetical protein HY079_00405 [Elusimicrobia bacterium]|nr:hypothetical protein [Elusimicrobiota bacterium]